MSFPSDARVLRTFRSLVQNYLDETHERFPETASRLGLARFNDRLGRNDIAAYRAQIFLTEETLASVESQPEAAFTGDDWLDRRTFLAMLRTDLLHSRDLLHWRTNPQLHCDAAVDSIFDLLVRNAGNLGPVQPAIESRLARLPDYLAAGAECIQRPVPLWTKLAGKSCDGAIGFLQEIEITLLEKTKSPARLKRLLAAARKAFGDYATTISRRQPGPAKGYSIGRSNFEYLMRERLGFDCTLPETSANGRRLVAQMTHLLEQEAARHGRKSARA